MTTIATLFSGGEGVGVGAKDAGLTHLWGIEYDDPIAQVARDNGLNTITADVMDIDPSTLPIPDVLHASPVCKRASVANQGAELNEDGTKEAPEDIATGEKVAQFIDVMTPKIFTLENVFQYRTFKAFKIICAALNRNGYMWDFDNLNSADYGVPQTRQRLILRAKRGALLPNLPQPVRWIGWYEAIEDLIPTLPTAYHGKEKQPCEWDPAGRPCRQTQGVCRGHFAEWQLARLPEEIRSTFAVNSAELKNTIREVRPYAAHEPFGTVQASEFRRPVSVPRAFILDGTPDEVKSVLIAQGHYGDSLVLSKMVEPSFTITANSNQSGTKAFILDGMPSDNGRCVTLPQGDTPVFTVMSSQDHRPLRAYLVSGGNSFQPVLEGDAPSTKLGASPSTNLHHRAYLVDGQNAGREMTLLPDSKPACTDGASGKGATRAWLSQGRVVTMTVEALARFQSFPKWYRFTGTKKTNVTIIGNAVPPLLYEVIIRDLVR